MLFCSLHIDEDRIERQVLALSPVLTLKERGEGMSSGRNPYRVAWDWVRECLYNWGWRERPVCSLNRLPPQPERGKFKATARRRIRNGRQECH